MKFLNLTSLLFFSVLITVNSFIPQLQAPDANTDKQTLLSFKSSISDPSDALSDWNSISSHCSWYGVNCTKGSRVQSLQLSSLNLSGIMPSSLSNLTSLKVLDLSNNLFYGQISLDFLKLPHLRHIILAQNNFYGSIPSSLSNCHGLEEITLYANHLTGALPYELGNLSRLSIFYVALNNLSGAIPHTYGNLSSLTMLFLARNNFTHKLPNELGNLKNLRILQLSENYFTREIPHSIFNISSLVFISLSKNYLVGELPTDLGLHLPNLTGLYLAQNMLEGEIPSTTVNASLIQDLDLSSNQFQGSLPLFGAGLHGLVRLHVGYNNLTSTTDLNFQFFEYLTNCLQLEKLILSSNNLTGYLPKSFANLSTQLTELCIDDNFFTGGFPGLEKFENLTALAIQQNYFTGQVPKSVGKLLQLQRFLMNDNMFSGEIPDIFDNLSKLFMLRMETNLLYGKIPESIAQCQSLTTLVLAGNKLDGSIPVGIFGIQTLVYVIFADNALTGPFPSEVGNLKQLESLDFSNNQLSGHIPQTIGGCSSLHNLVLANNTFNGSIPDTIGKLSALESLDLSFNDLSGQIPDELADLKLLNSLKLSFNDLEGQVPRNGVFVNISRDSLQGNENLCSTDLESASKLGISTCATNKKNKDLAIKIAVPILCSVLLICLVFCFAWSCIYQKKRAKRGNASPLFRGLLPKISYADIRQATDDFSPENLIGRGGYGSVYKGIFCSEVDNECRIFAIKVIDLKQSKALHTFNAECEALKNVRHRNLVKVITSCSSIDHAGAEFKALITEFMINGNLDKWLYPEDRESSMSLNLLQRLNITIDIASAMNYLHHDCDPPVVHCDLKPANVLLDENMEAHVGDFGLARFLDQTPSQNESSTVALKGSIGYIAPEYGLGGKVSTSGDVYSFGILLLEIFIAKKPTDRLFESLSVADFVSANQQDVTDIIDPLLFKDNDFSIYSMSTCGSNNSASNESSNCNWQRRIGECLTSLIKMGLSCAAYLPKDRLTTREALTKLLDIRRSLLEL